ncbi:MAG: hypothetical protein LBR38_02200 [Synergistaceae bacterium]|jgi:hypothetical protein|nr:hypothetical protein [Synergistaceae bacterium]
MRAFRALYAAMPPAMLATLWLFGFTKLEMAANLGWVFFGVWAALFAAFLLLGRFFRQVGSFKFAVIDLALCLIAAFALLGLRRLLVVPAAVLREGLCLPHAPFAWINAALALFLLLGLALLRLCPVKGVGDPNRSETPRGLRPQKEVS